MAEEGLAAAAQPLAPAAQAVLLAHPHQCVEQQRDRQLVVLLLTLRLIVLLLLLHDCGYRHRQQSCPVA